MGSVAHCPRLFAPPVDPGPTGTVTTLYRRRGLRIAVLSIVAILAALPIRPSAACAQTPGLVVLLATDASEYGDGATVSFTVAVDNSGDAPVTVTFPSAQLFDIVVRTEEREVWRW